MLNSIFRKQFVSYIGVLLITFFLLGCVLLQVFNQYFTTQKEKVLIEQGEKISALYEKAVSPNFFDRISITQTLTQLSNQFEILNEYLEASFFIVDTNFTIKMVSKDIDSKYIGGTLNIPALASVMNGEIVTAQGKIAEIYKEPVLTVACPVIIEGTVVAAICMNSSVPELQRTIYEAYRMGLWCLLISGAIAFVLVYFSSKTMSKPLHEMNQAAKVIADGNFEKRIKVESHDEVGQLAESFNYMAKSLYEQEKARKEFIANISHDFRTPLTTIRGFLQAIQDGTIPIDKQSRYIDIVLDETNRLSKLANDILDLNKIQNLNIEINLESFDLNELIRKTIMHFETGILNKKLDVNVKFADEKNIVSADYEKIHRVLYNLLDNAIKFTNEGGSIVVETTTSEEKVFVSIKDSGIGISEDEKNRVFERFYKVDTSRGADKRGSGLGLSIVKEFIKAHGETITLNSKPGEGCQFIFTLQLAHHNFDE